MTITLEKPIKYVPEPSPTKLVDRFHLEAELERLARGQDGCGCSLCQQYYKMIDLSRYGSRVITFGDTVIIKAGKQGASKYQDETDCWAGNNDIFIHHGKKYVVKAFIPDNKKPYNVPINIICLGDIKPSAIPLKSRVVNEDSVASGLPTQNSHSVSNTVSVAGNNCLVCGRELDRSRSTKRFCNSTCRSRYKRQKELKNG